MTKKIKLKDGIKIYDSGYRGNCNKEDADLKGFIAWLDYNYPQYSELTFHVENERKCYAGQGRDRKAKGVRTGIPDIVCLYPVGGHPYAVFELKRKDRTKSNTLEVQKNKLNSSLDQGAFVALCYGLECIKEAFTDYIRGEGEDNDKPGGRTG